MTEFTLAYLDHIDDLLIEWGKAANQNTINLNYKLGVLGKLKGSTVKSASIDDELYLRIDAAVSALYKDQKILADVAVYIYIKHKRYQDISRIINRSPSSIVSYRKQITDFIANYLNN